MLAGLVPESKYSHRLDQGMDLTNAKTGTPPAYGVRNSRLRQVQPSSDDGAYKAISHRRAECQRRLGQGHQATT